VEKYFSGKFVWQKDRKKPIPQKKKRTKKESRLSHAGVGKMQG